MKRKPKHDEVVRDAMACASYSLGESFKPYYGNYLYEHYLELLPGSAAAWLTLKNEVTAACHLRMVTSIPKMYHFPVMVLELAALSKRLAPEEYKNHPYYVGLRAIDLAIYKVEIEPFMKTMKPEMVETIQRRLKVLEYKYPN